MIILKLSMLIMGFILASCQAGGDSSNQRPKKSSTDDSLTPVDNGVTDENSGVGTLTGDAKCWKKMLETQEYLACKNSGKIFNRTTKKCVDADISLTNDCSAIKAEDIQNAHTEILKQLPKAHLTTDQCGSYQLGDKKHSIAYIMGQQFDEASAAEEKGASYKIKVRLICYFTKGTDDSTNATNRAMCNHSDLALVDNQSESEESLGSCD